MIIIVKQGFRFVCQMGVFFRLSFLQVINFLVAFDNINYKTSVLHSAMSRKVESRAYTCFLTMLPTLTIIDQIRSYH